MNKNRKRVRKEPQNNKLENAGQPAYFGASVLECGFDKKMGANPARCGTFDRSVYDNCGEISGCEKA